MTLKKRAKILGGNIRAARLNYKPKKMSLQELAVKVGSSKSHMWELENGGNPSVFLLEDIAKTLKTTVSKLLSK